MPAEKRLTISPADFVFTILDAYTSGDTVLVDQTADSVETFHLGGGTKPTASLGSADSNFEKTVTLTGGSSGKVVVVTYHPNGAASTKPASRS
jgi:hypothetical protein